jgi:hypothetical protein
MAAETPDVGLDDQDHAETFDETNLDDDAEFVTLEEMPDVYDATRALGDSRDLQALDAAELDADSLDDEDLEDDEDIDDELLDDLEDDDEDDEIDDADADGDDGVDRLEPDEVTLVAVADVDSETNPDDEDESDYESEDLSDDDLEDLGYRDEKSGADDDAPAGGHPDDVPDDVSPHQDELLDEGVEETFPASDPVSVKRIT